MARVLITGMPGTGLLRATATVELDTRRPPNEVVDAIEQLALRLG